MEHLLFASHSGEHFIYIIPLNGQNLITKITVVTYSYGWEPESVTHHIVSSRTGISYFFHLTLSMIFSILKWKESESEVAQSCLTLCDPIDGSPPGSPIPGILQTRTLEWVAISFSNAWKWKWKWSRSVVSDSWLPHGLQPTSLLHPWDFQARVLEWGVIAFSTGNNYWISIWKIYSFM